MAETVNFFGKRLGMWQQCSGILLNAEDGGSSLGIHALQTAKVLGVNHPSYYKLLKKAQKWTSVPVASITPYLDKHFRERIFTESSKLLGKIKADSSASDT